MLDVTFPSRCGLRYSARSSAFSLIEILVVIGIISILAGLIFPVATVVKKAQKLNAAKAELSEIQTAIEAYKAKLGSYPPDNPGNPVTNQLYYELQGTIRTNKIYTSLDGTTPIPIANLPIDYGPQVSGFMNASGSGRNSDEGSAAVNFLKTGLHPNQFCLLSSGINILVCSVPWDNGDPATWPISGSGFASQPPAINPWRYVSTNPTNNSTSYDLWADIYIRGKIYRVNNWTKEPQLINP